MILLLDTSTPTCRLTLIGDDRRLDDEWEAGHDLAKGLLRYLTDHLAAQGKHWVDISAIGVRKGPGSFTGLRIGLTVLNTIADTYSIPIVGVSDEPWQEIVIRRLRAGENDMIVLPVYGSEPNITKPRK